MENASVKNWSNRSEVEIHFNAHCSGRNEDREELRYIAAYTARVNIIERLSPSVECYCEIVCEQIAWNLLEKP